MSLAVKRNVLGLVLVLSAVWPAAHYFVVREFNLNPWNWFGWAMYTKPADRLLVRSYSPDGVSVTSQLPTLTQLQRDSLMQAYRPWSLRYLELGDFDDPDEFARAILVTFDAWSSVRIEVSRYGLERESACVAKLSVKTYEYTRADVGLD